MGRVLGKIENNTLGTRYFVHCSTSGYSLTPLIQSVEEAWSIYGDEEDSEALKRTVPACSKVISVATVSIAYGKKFTSIDDIMHGPTLGLVTEDRLLFPTSEDDAGMSLLLIEGVIHIGRTVNGGFFGDYEEPICQGRHAESESVKVLDLSDYLNKPMTLCPHCIAKATDGL